MGGLKKHIEFAEWLGNKLEETFRANPELKIKIEQKTIKENSGDVYLNLKTNLGSVQILVLCESQHIIRLFGDEELKTTCMEEMDFLNIPLIYVGEGWRLVHATAHHDQLLSFFDSRKTVIEYVENEFRLTDYGEGFFDPTLSTRLRVKKNGFEIIMAHTTKGDKGFVNDNKVYSVTCKAEMARVMANIYRKQADLWEFQTKVEKEILPIFPHMCTKPPFQMISATRQWTILIRQNGDIYGNDIIVEIWEGEWVKKGEVVLERFMLTISGMPSQEKALLMLKSMIKKTQIETRRRNRLSERLRNER